MTRLAGGTRSAHLGCLGGRHHPVLGGICQWLAVEEAAEILRVERHEAHGAEIGQSRIAPRP